MILERADFYLGFAQIVFFEVVEVDDQDAIGLEIGDIHFQRGGVHGHQNVDGIAGRVDVVRREVDLEATDSGQGARGGANFGREIREGGKVIAEESGGVGELAAGDLHAVAGVSTEANDGAVDDFFLASFDVNECGRHCSDDLPACETN